MAVVIYGGNEPGRSAQPLFGGIPESRERKNGRLKPLPRLFLALEYGSPALSLSLSRIEHGRAKVSIPICLFRRENGGRRRTGRMRRAIACDLYVVDI